MKGNFSRLIRNVSMRLLFATVFFYNSLQSAHAQSGSSNGSGGCPPSQLCNPLQSTTITEFLGKIIDILLFFALPIIVFFIIYSGFKFVMARGNESEVSDAKSSLTWAIIGGVIILGAKLIITVIQGTVSAL